MLKSEQDKLRSEIPDNLKPKATDLRTNDEMKDREVIQEEVWEKNYAPTKEWTREINAEIFSLTEKNKKIEGQIEAFLQGRSR